MEQQSSILRCICDYYLPSGITSYKLVIAFVLITFHLEVECMLIIYLLDLMIK
jgi:hypothetical protein